MTNKSGGFLKALLVLDEWNIILVWLGAIGFFISLLFPINVTLLSNNGLMVFSIGLFLIGLGECMKWKQLTYRPVNGSVEGSYPSYHVHTKNKTCYMSKRPIGIGHLVQFVGIILMLTSPFADLLMGIIYNEIQTLLS